MVRQLSPGGADEVLLLGEAPEALMRAIEGCGMVPRVAGAGAAGAVVVTARGPQPSALQLRRARLALGRRGRVFLMAASEAVPDLLMLLAAARLQPKRMMLLHRDERAAPHAAIVVALSAKPGGLEIHRVVDGRLPGGGSPQKRPAGPVLA